MDTTTNQLSNDDIFEVLSNTRRRQVIVLLYDEPAPVHLGDLAEEIAAFETDGPVTNEQYKRVYISLYQTHVPKLSELGLVEYDAETKEISLTDRVDEVLEVFRLEEPAPSWWKYYAVLAAAGFIAVLGFWLSGPGNQLVGIVVALVPIIALLVLVFIHYRYRVGSKTVPIDRLLE